MKQQSMNNSNKIAILNDTHCGIKGSSQHFIEYQRRFYEEVFFPYLLKNGINQIWHLGDAFNSRTSIDFRALYEHRKMFLEPLVENNIHMTIIPGNHDTLYKSSSLICSLKELFGYFTENVSILMEPTEIQYSAKCKALWIPWVNQENRVNILESIKRSDANLALGHFEFSGFEMQKGIQSTEGTLNTELMKKFKMVLSGHFHTKSTKENIIYLGSQMQFTWADCDDQKFFHVIDPTTMKLEAIKNPIEIYKRVYYNDSNDTEGEKKTHKIPTVKKSDYAKKFVRIVVESKNRPYDFDRFIEKIEHAEPLDIKIIDSSVYNDLVFSSKGDDTTNEENNDTKTTTECSLVINQYVDSLEEIEQIDKNRLKSLMMNIYSEAENLEVLS